MVKVSAGSMNDSVGRLYGSGTVAAMGESQLVDRLVAGGDPSAFEAIIGRHGPMVLGVCRRVLADPNDVDDAFQATFLLLVRKADSIRNRDNLGPWLHGVARRVAVRARVDARRRRARERARTPEPVRTADDASELRAVIDDELARLPERYRSVVILCDLEGQTQEDVAERLRCPVGTVKSRLSRGRDRLRSRLVRRGLGPAVGLVASTLAAGRASAVPEILIGRTIRGTSGTVPVAVASLMKGVLSSMTCSISRLVVLAALSVVVATCGVGAFVRQAPAQSERDEPRQAPLAQVQPIAEKVDESVERMTLGNGLKVILRPIKGAKDVSVVVLYSIGSDQDPAGRCGLSHLAEHIYLTAAAGIEKSRTVEELAQRYPGGSNGQTGDRYTVFATTVPEKDLDAELRDASARMGDLRVVPADLDREVPRLVEEVGNMFGNFPALAALNNARELVRPTPSNGRRGGTPESMRAIRTLDVQQHLGRYYRPRNAILAISGPFDPAKARALIQEHFAKLDPGVKAPPAKLPGPPSFGTLKEIAVKSPDPDDSSMACLAYLAPSPDSDLYAPFLVLTTRLWANIEKLGGDDQVGFPVYFTPMDDGAVLAVSTPARPGETPRQAFDRLEAFVAESIAPKLGVDEPANALAELGPFLQTVAAPDEILARNPYGVAFALGRRDQMGLDPARFNRALRGVTEEALRKTATEVFAPAKHAGAFVKN